MAYILTFLTLLLSAVPCCQKEDHCDESEHEVSQSIMSSGDDCPESDGPCSPFYACGSCPGCIGTEFVKTDEIPSLIPRIQISNMCLESESKSLPQKLLRPPIPEFS